jgi:hypothetical protein
MARCENGLVNRHAAGNQLIAVAGLITQRSHGKGVRRPGCAAVDIRPQGAVMDGESGWIMSSRSTGNGGSCVQARCHAGWIEVRNSKSPEAGTVRFTAEEWDSFLDGAKKGEFDRLLAS